MGKLPALSIAVFLLGCCWQGRAQAPEITVDTKPADGEIQDWLKSGDPRLVAWGAYFAGRKGENAATPLLAQLVEQWIPPSGEPDVEQTNAMAEVLDALIQRRGKVSPEGLEAIRHPFPNQAIILASMLPSKEAAPLLMTWYAERNGKDYAAFPRVAAMLLSREPPPGFAATVVAESEEKLLVAVVSGTSGIGWGSGASSSCGDGWGAGTPPGWPPLFRYGLEENSPKTHNPVLVRAGGDTITYVRIATQTGWGSCFDPHPLTASTRVKLVVQMLGGDGGRIPWPVEQHTSISYETDGQYLRGLSDQIHHEEAQMHFATEALQARGFLSSEEADSVRPKLLVTVIDNRIAGSPPLPALEIRDPRTSLNTVN